MDIQHIAAWMEILSALGFSSSMGRQLLWNACLGQKEFVIQERLQFGEDRMSYQLYFKEDPVSKGLTCAYYDATLRKAVTIPDAVVNGIETIKLAQRMDAVNWHMQAKNDDSNDAVDPADNTTWEQEAIVERIINDLEQLAAIDGGAAIANTLKYKCWADLDLQRLIPELAMLKSRYELSQRFYIIQGEGISTHEAYRFLLNRWMERKLQADSRLLRQQEAASQMVKMDTKDSGDKKKNNRSKKNIAK